MRKIVKCPGGVAALAEVKAEAAGSPKQPQKPAETPRDVGGKRQRTPTPSTLQILASVLRRTCIG